MNPTDRLQRPLHDLRISVTDRCNFRCRYCMPAEEFGADHAFLPREEILTFEEIVRLTRVASRLGVTKARLTGGEPLLRRGLDDLIAMIATVPGIEDIALTTNGTLLAHHAEALALAGLSRVTVSLDALNPDTFGRMNGVGAKVERVLSGITAARTFDLGVKINCVIQKGVNEQEILPLARWAATEQLSLRFIEFMDVGETNHWDARQVVPADEILTHLRTEFRLEPLQPTQAGETARRWRLDNGPTEIGIIASVSQPFCRACNRLRLSADGRIYTCLFASQGHDLRPLLRGAADDNLLEATLRGLWSARDDRYSELRGQTHAPKAEMSYLGG
ncbi:cyclic pyranopterin phosphate synthase [Haloferula luteola]|uniref:GTP 3',8-cyclase n=1 Tax=Haloferula luteola TaxID=595692 RepID=A0A840VCZ0_9BACT|nr:GTP 3',8-cyclase MoaA [Haloferula luteola]MBB5350721.1 cyclic pyranopterin phosphate synthase [Haloferula luteola]